MSGNESMASADCNQTPESVPLGMEVSHRAPRWARRFYSYFGFTSVLSELDE